MMDAKISQWLPRPGPRIVKTALAVTVAVWLTGITVGERFTASAGIAAVLSMQPTWEQSRTMTWTQMMTAIAGAIWGGAAGLIFVNNPLWIGINVFLLFAVGKWLEQERFAALSVTVLLLTMVHSDQLLDAVYRLISTLFGLTAGLAVNFTLWRPPVDSEPEGEHSSAD